MLMSLVRVEHGERALPEKKGIAMERIETIDLEADTQALEAGHGITLYIFDEQDRLRQYAHVVASTPRERGEGYADYFLTVFTGGHGVNRFVPDDGDDYPDLESILTHVKVIWTGASIWWERDGKVPGVDEDVTLDDFFGTRALASARHEFVKEMSVRGIEPDGKQAARDERIIRDAGLDAVVPSFFELFENYVTDEDRQFRADGVELAARTAWMRETHRAMLRAMKG